MSVSALLVAVATLAGTTTDAAAVAVKLPLTLIEIDINKLGRVVNCRIAASSGQSQLDEKACSIALARFRFQPAMMNGEPVASKKTMPIKWAVNGGEAK